MLGKFRQWFSAKPAPLPANEIDDLMREFLESLDHSDQLIRAAAEATDGGELVEQINRVMEYQNRYQVILKILDADLIGPLVQMKIMECMARSSQQLDEIGRIQEEFMARNDIADE
jgi:hypothetical protein